MQGVRERSSAAVVLVMTQLLQTCELDLELPRALIEVDVEGMRVLAAADRLALGLALGTAQPDCPRACIELSPGCGLY